MIARATVSLLFKFNAIVFFAAFLSWVNQAIADGPGLDIQFTTGGQELNAGSFSLGWTFSVTSPVTVSALGFYDAGQNGLTTSHDVGIYDANCSLIASATVQPTDALTGYFRYHNLTSPVVLSPGQTYRIAAVTGGEPYLYNPTAVVLDPAVVFDKFTAWRGALQQTTTLQCPDFPSTTQFYGDFGPTFYIGALGGGTDPVKRDTSIKLFCNRTGDLSSANCTATVGDAGAPPRIQPTGTVEFTTTEGSLAGMSCQLQGVSLSPGIASCSVTYIPPAGFPIGKAFPINATYDGDSAFNPSSTSHEVIRAACIGTPEKPCPNSVGLEFDRVQTLLKKVVTIRATCGSEAQTQIGRNLRIGGFEPPPPGGSCHMFMSLGLDLDKLIKEVSQPDLKAISDAFTQNPKNLRDAVFEYANAASTLQNALYMNMQATQAATDEIYKLLEKNVLNENWLKLFGKYGSGHGFSLALKTAKGKRKKQSFIKFATVDRVVKADKTTTLKFKLNRRMQNLVGILKAAGAKSVPIRATLSLTQKKRSGKATLVQTVDVALE